MMQFGNHGHRDHGSFLPIFFSAYPYNYDDLGNDEQDQQPDQRGDQPIAQQSQPQPQTSDLGHSATAQQVADPGDDVGNLSTAVSDPQPALPVPDVGNFIFVRRDGRILFASIFSVVGSQLQYVSPEGIRRSLAMSDIDTDATQQMNEARGTTVLFHN